MPDNFSSASSKLRRNNNNSDTKRLKRPLLYHHGCSSSPSASPPQQLHLLKLAPSSTVDQSEEIPSSSSSRSSVNSTSTTNTSTTTAHIHHSRGNPIASHVLSLELMVQVTWDLLGCSRPQAHLITADQHSYASIRGSHQQVNLEPAEAGIEINEDEILRRDYELSRV